MRARFRALFAALVLVLLRFPSVLQAQNPPPPAPVQWQAPGTLAPTPQPVPPANPPVTPVAPPPIEFGSQPPIPPPPPGGMAPPPPGGYFQPLIKNPLLTPPPSPPPGWFMNLEVNLLGPHVSNQLSGPVTLAGGTDQIALPSAALDWVGSPRIDVGYRMAGGLGEFRIGYQSLVSSGRAIAVDFEGSGNDGGLRSRLNMNVVDFLYGSRDYSLAPNWDLNWKAGVRLATVYFDSQAQGVFLGQSESNNFVGAGPIAGFGLQRRFESCPLFAVFGSLDGAVLVGHVHQAFQETVDLTPLGGSLVGGASDNSGTHAVPVLAFRVGLSYIPTWEAHWTRFSLGYEFQQYWGIGNAGGSHADLQTNGIFFRAEMGF